MLRGNMEHVTSEPMAGQGDLHHSSACFGSPFEQWHPHFHAVRDITDRPLLPGNDMQVLVDSTGSRYSWPSIFKALKASQIPCARFLPFSAIKKTFHAQSAQPQEIIDSERSRWVYGRDEHASGAFYQW